MRRFAPILIALVLPATAPAAGEVTLYEREVLCQRLGGDTRWVLREYHDEAYHALAACSKPAAQALVTFAKGGGLDALPSRRTILLAIADSGDADAVSGWVIKNGSELLTPLHAEVFAENPSEYARHFRVLEKDVARRIQAAREKAAAPPPPPAEPAEPKEWKTLRENWVGMTVVAALLLALLYVCYRKFVGWRRARLNGDLP